ncbi:hypothetical protein GIB67_009111 [Kingdonia uniflora]|uniref:Uncharacterized protein n=1 Tax=Kingdonia uniflora TaxID=39325 RepID=A0A7J7N3Y1_9MAGN|nr:hypothetical protein GIB67_009111 [Kingdonia uniflora]
MYHGLDNAVTTGGAITGFSQLLELTGTVGIPLDPPLSMSPHLSPADLHAMRQAGFVDCKQFVIGEERETYASYWAAQTAEVGPLLIDFQRMGNIDLFRPSALRAGITPVVVTSASVHSLSQDFSLPESAQNAQRIQELTDEVATLMRHLNSVDDQLYAHVLHLRKEHDAQVVPLPPGGIARTRQRGSGLQTKGGGTSRRGRHTGDDSDPSQ